MASRNRDADIGSAQRSDDDGTDRGHESAKPSCRAGVQSRAQKSPLGETEAQEGSMTVWVCVNTSKQVGDKEIIVMSLRVMMPQRSGPGGYYCFRNPRTFTVGDAYPRLRWRGLHDIPPSQGRSTRRLIMSKSRVQRPPSGGSVRHSLLYPRS